MNGAYKTAAVAAREARRTVRGMAAGILRPASKSFRTYRTEYGYGFALVGSAAEIEMVESGTDDGNAVTEISAVLS